MRIVVLLLMSFCAPVFAGNWFPIGKSGANTVYALRHFCESTEQAPCFEISGKDSRHLVVEDVQVDDLSKPLFLKKKSAACADQADCQSKLEALDCSDLASGSKALIDEGYTEVYCAEPNGYEKKTVKQVKVDPAKKAIADAEDKAVDDDKKAKKNRKKKIKQAKAAIDASSLEQPIKDFLKDLADDLGE